MLNLIRNTVSNFRMSGATQAANNFLAATGITGQTQSNAINQLVADLHSSGLWSKMKAVYPMVTDNVNQLQYTTTFNSTYYRTDGTSTITANYTTAPDGTNTAARMLGNTASSYMYYNINDGLGSGNRTYSIYLKAGSDTNVLLTFNSDGTTVSQSVTLTSSWQRFQLTKNITNSSSGFYITVENVGSGLDLFMWGVQVEFGTTASAYQPIATTPSAFMASQMKYNLKDARDLDAAFRLTWSGGWTYSATGATPNGTNAYADTKFNTNGLSSLHFAYYSRTTNTVGREMGNETSNACDLIISLSGTIYSRFSNSSVNLANSDSKGFYIGTEAPTLSHKLFKNGTQLGSSAAYSGAYNNLPVYIGAINLNSVAQYFGSKQSAFASIGDGLTDQDSLLLNQIVEKFQVALSRGVQAAQSFYYNSAYSNEANTYLYSTQITGTTQVSAINTLINGLKANNLWSKMKAVYPFVTDYRNLFAYTEDFSNAYWIKNNSSVTSNSAIAPNGTLTADTLIPNAGTNINEPIVYVIVDNTTQTRTISFYAKPAGYNYAYARIGGATPVALALFDLSNGTVVQTQAPAISASIESVGNGWYRCQMVYPNSPSLYAPNIGTCSSTYTISSTGITTTTNGTSGIYIWGAQLESGAQATPYQPVLAANSSSTFMSSQMKFNLVNPQDSDAAFRLAFSGGWTYSTNGAQPNGTNGYADTKLNQTAAGMFTNSHLSYYSRTNSTTATAQVEMGVGATVAGTFTNLLMRLDTVTNYIGGSIGSRNALSTSANSNGHLIVNALSAAAKAFKNGVLVATDTTTQTGTLNTLPIYIGCQNNNSVAGQFSSRQAAFASIGDGLTDAEALILYNLIQQYQTDLSRQV